MEERLSRIFLIEWRKGQIDKNGGKFELIKMEARSNGGKVELIKTEERSNG